MMEEVEMCIGVIEFKLQLHKLLGAADHDDAPQRNPLQASLAPAIW